MAASPAPPLDEVAIGASTTRKATLHLLPLILLGYGASYMDRINISYAALQMNRDLHFSATVYGFGAGLFFLSYAACEIPSNLLLYRFGARRWLARIMVTWGILAMAMLFVRTPWQFYTIRFLLGTAEAGFFPGVLFYLMHWFPPELRARSVSRFYIAVPIGSVFMGVIAGALLNLDGHLGLRGWQWLFLVEGLPPVLLGIAYLFLLPDTPAQASWLSPGERLWISRHVTPHMAAANTRDHHSIVPAFADPRVWQLGTFMLLMLASSYAYLFIAPEIIQEATHQSNANTGFILAALNLPGVAAMLLNSVYSDRVQHRNIANTLVRYGHIIPWALMISAGFIVCGISRSGLNAMLGIGMLVVSVYAMQGPLWAIAAGFHKGRTAAAGIAAMNTIAIVGGFLGPYFMGLAKDLTGDYQRGLLLMATPMLFGTGIMFYMRHQARTEATPT